MVTSPLTTTSAISSTVNVNHATYAHQSPNLLRTIPATGVKVETGHNIVIKNEPNPVSSTNYIKQEPITIGSTNTGTVQYLNTSSNVVLGNNAQTVTRPASTIYDFASVAAEQKRLTVQTIKSEVKPTLSTTITPASNIITLQNALQRDSKSYTVANANTQSKPHMVQTIIKPESAHVQASKVMQGGMPQTGVKQEIKFVTQNPGYSQAQGLPHGPTQILASQPVPGSLGNVLRTNPLTLGTGATVITRTTKPMSAPQTVTVLRAPSSQTHAIHQQPGQQQTIQIVNVSNSNTPRVSVPASVAMAQQKMLAPRIVTSSGVKIAPTQQPHMTMPIRPAAVVCLL